MDDRLEELEQEGRDGAPHDDAQHRPLGDQGQSSLQPSQQVQQQLDQLQVIDDDDTPSEWGEPPPDLFVEGFGAELEDEYNRLFPEDGSDPQPLRRRLRGKQTVPARLQMLNLAGGECCHEEEAKHLQKFHCQGCGLLQLQAGQGLQHGLDRQQPLQGLHHQRALHGGECLLRMCAFCEEFQEVERSEDETEEVPQEQDWGEIKVQQHCAISKLIGEEMAILDGSCRDHQVWMKTLTMLQEEREKIEEEILASKPKEEEVLQGRTVSNAEVRNNFEEWREPIEKELKTLTGNGAIVPITKEQRDEMIKEHGSTMECIPSKVVAVVKAGGRRKARLVACGNYAITDRITQEEKTASGADIVALRMLIRLAAHYGWDCSSLDIKGAFLLAPRRKRNLTVLSPPKVLQEKNLIPKGTMWMVNKAVYGLVESPADWGSYRDEELHGIRWNAFGVTYKLQMTREANIWKILEESGEEEAPCGYLATYVDDMLMVGSNSILHGLMDAISAKWECSSKEFAEEGKDLRFCGMEIRKTRKGFDLHQSSYIQDLLNRREVRKKADFPMGKLEDLEEEDVKKVSVEQLRAAQQLAGELIWVSTRTRMDVSFAVGAMSRRLHKDPEGALCIGQQILEYLNQYPTLGVSYTPCDVMEMDHSQVPRQLDTVEVFADVSFAPGSESYKSIHGIVTTLGGQVIQWHTGRQPLIATSTAEGELLSYQEAQVMGAGVEEMLYEVGLKPVVIMYGDKKAAISLATLETGSWRTRHLRIRAGKLRQTLKSGTAPQRPPWQLRHMPGTELIADGLTKPLGRQAFLEFVRKSKMTSGKTLELKHFQVEPPQTKTSDLLPNDNEDNIYYKQMVALTVAGLLLILIGEHHLAAVLLLVLKCSQLVRGEGTSSGVKRCLQGGEESVLEENVKAAVRAMRVDQAPRRELEDLSDHVNRLIEHCPTGHDRWLPIQPGQWLLRSHGRYRKRSFHPLHQNCPVNFTELESTRFTVIFHGNGGVLRTFIRDEWDATPVKLDYGDWRGYTIFKIKEDEPAAVGPRGGYGGRDPAVSSSRQRGGDAMPPRQTVRSKPASYEKVTAELQQIGKGRPPTQEVLQGPLPPRPAQVRDVAASTRPDRARGSNDLPDSGHQEPSPEVRGAAEHPNLRGRVCEALYIDPHDFVDSLQLSREDFVPEEFLDEDDGFQLVSSGESSTSTLTSSSTSSSSMDLASDVEIDPPQGQRGIWDAQPVQ